MSEWESKKTEELPSTDKEFYMTSYHDYVIFVKPGREYIFNEKWIENAELKEIKRKIATINTSPMNKATIHIPKDGTYIALMENKPNPKLTRIPIPFISADKEGDLLHHAVLPGGMEVLITTPIEDKVGKSALKGTSIVSSLRGYVVSDTAKIAAIATNSKLFIWQQLDDHPRGVGYWYDLTSDARFNVSMTANNPYMEGKKLKHGFMRREQRFTLHPALIPELQINQPITYQDLALFDNPDEGRGVICLTVTQPPMKMDTSAVLNLAVCKFTDNGVPTFEKNIAHVSTTPGEGMPCIWWSPDCRVAVIAVGQCILIVTRKLEIINRLELKDVFHGPNQMVASVAWSSSSRFFIITSMKGQISIIPRIGKAMHHDVGLCALKFGPSPDVPLMACGDMYNPGSFTVFSRRAMARLRLDMTKINNSLENLISLPFPLGSSAKMYDPAVESIESIEITNLQEVMKMLYYTDIFNLFPNYSPLRYYIMVIATQAIKHLYDEGMYLMAMFLSRCVLRLTDTESPVYQDIMERLSYSDAPRDRAILKLLDLERQFADWNEDIDPPVYENINIFDDEEGPEKPAKIKQPCFKDFVLRGHLKDILPIIEYTLFGKEEDTCPGTLPCQMQIGSFFDFLVSAGRVKAAIEIAKHPSLHMEPYELFERIIPLVRDKPELIYTSMVEFISKSPQNEERLRGIAIMAYVSLMKEVINNTTPDRTRKLKPVSEFVHVEEQFEIYCPDTVEECKDFAAITSLAIAAADYRHIYSFLDRRESDVPEEMKHPIYELFRMLWFVYWRYHALGKGASDATLRLVGFKDFPASNEIKERILMATYNYTDVLYKHYMEGSGEYNLDPEFPEFCNKLMENIDPKAVSRVASHAHIFANEDSQLPYSNILLYMATSHLIPILRCMVPRILNGFIITEERRSVPDKLIIFEEGFELKEKPDPKLEMNNTAKFDIPPYESTSGSGIFVPPNPTEKKRRRKKRRKQEVIERQHHKRRRKRSPSPEEETKSELRPLLIGKKKRYQAPLWVDYPQYYQPPPQPMENYYEFQPNYYGPMPDVIHGYVDTGPQEVFGSIWDLDPAAFEENKPVKQEPAPKPKPVEEAPPPRETKTTATTQTQVEKPPKPRDPSPPTRGPPVRPTIIVASRPPPPQMPEFDLDLSMTSELSDFQVGEVRPNTDPYADPYPLDEALQARVNRLLDQVDSDAKVPPLKDPPKAVYPETKPLPPVNVFIVKEGGSSSQQETREVVYNEVHTTYSSHQEGEFAPPPPRYKIPRATFATTPPNREDDFESTDALFQPDFLPRVVSMRSNNIVSMRNQNQETQPTASDGLGGPSTRTSNAPLMLMEIRPSNNSDEK